MKQYLVSKANYNGEVVYLNIDKTSGYKVNPKNNIPYEGIKVNEMVIIKPDFIQKIIKKKLKNKLEFYLSFIISDDETDSEDTRRALDDLQRYRYFVKERYSSFLDNKYLVLLNNKFDILERNLKSKIINKSIKKEEKYVEENEHKRSR